MSLPSRSNAVYRNCGVDRASQPASNMDMAVTLKRRRFTVDEYHRMAEVRILAPGERVELIDTAAHPVAADVLLLIEVADSSLAVDRRVRMPLYARAAIREAWILDLTADRVEARRLRRSDSHRRGFARLTDQGAMTRLARTPIFSISASTRSPALRNLPSAATTPSGVPVAMTSPGKSVKPCESTAMHSSTGKIIFEVWLDWRGPFFSPPFRGVPAA